MIYINFAIKKTGLIYEEQETADHRKGLSSGQPQGFKSRRNREIRETAPDEVNHPQVEKGL